MSESFAALFEESLKSLDVERGAVISGTVVAIDADWITVDTGLKSEGVIAREEFLDDRRELEVAVGDTVDVVIKAVPFCLAKMLSVLKPGLASKRSSRTAKSSRASSPAKLRAASPWTWVPFAPSCLVHWSTFVRSAIPRILKVVSWNSSSSSWMPSATT